MQLIIEVDEHHIVAVAEQYLRSALRVNEYGAQNQIVEYITNQTKAATFEYLKGVDWKVMVHTIAQQKLEEITNDVVHKIIESHVKKVVKQMKSEGELV